MENKHKHYEMIVAKAANMDLVVFIKCQNEWKEQQCNSDQLNFSCGHDYFLCLPQHKEAVLHALNGGDIQYKGDVNWAECVVCHDTGNVKWRSNWWYMDKDTHTRIKPKKEKRWIAYHKDGFLFDKVGNDYREIKEKVMLHELSDFIEGEWQYKEIEVEV